jgi:hypothetical protein
MEMEVNYRRGNDQEEMQRFKESEDLALTVLEENGWVEKEEKSSEGTKVFTSGQPGEAVLMLSGSKGMVLTKMKMHEKEYSGDIFKFLYEEQGLNIGQVRQKLRSLEGQPQPERRPNFKKIQKREEKTESERREIIVRYWNSCTHTKFSSYLQSRGIDADTQANFNFKLDSRGNTVFPICDKSGICGAEKRNFNFKGQEEWSMKGLWFGGKTEDPDLVFFAESPIDCISFYQINKDKELYSNKTLYLATCGGMDGRVKGFIRSAIKKNQGAKIASGFDNDKQGDAYTAFLENEAQGRDFERFTPKTKDWNEDLQENQQGTKGKEWN